MIFNKDCQEALREVEKSSVDLIFTSPPYADARKKNAIKPDEYVAWMLPKTDLMYDVLKPSGSLVINIKEKVVDGERHTYVIDLIKAMRDQGWYWVEEYCWHKKNSFPGKWPTRFRDSWERVLHFTKNKQFAMYQEAVMVPIGDWADSRLKKLSEADQRRDESKVGSGFGKNVSNWVGRQMVYPSNVLHMATETKNRGHCATFPEFLPEWFVRLFTVQGDVVLDPFAGSGTTLAVAKRLGRKCIGIEIDPDFCDIATERVRAVGG